MYRLFIALAATGSLLIPAAAAELTLRFTGTEFEGMPSFEARLGDAVVGEGTLSEISESGETFVFEVPDTLRSEPLRIRFTNDRYRRDVGDRNLRLLHATLAGVELPPGAFEYRTDSGETLQAGGQLSGSGLVAIAAPPQGGWPFSEAAVSVPEPAVPAAAEVAVVEPRVAPPDCTASRLDLTGFANDARALSPEQTAELLGFAPGSGCAVTVTGYTSTVGDAALNIQVAQARAEAVAASLTAGQDELGRVEIVAFGETTEFGDDPAANRRVVVEARSP